MLALDQEIQFASPMYAVNANDLLKFKDDPVHPVNMMLVPMLTDTTVDCEPGGRNGYALLVSEEAGVQWPALVHVIRRGAGRYRGILKSHLRIYRKNGDTWERI
jgi:hypothetical protein